MNDYSEDIISLNSFQITTQLLPAKFKYLIAGRGTGKSYIVGAEIDENVRLMPRGITAVTQYTLAQALTKTLPSAFEYLERIGYRRYNSKTKTGNYVICQKPPEHFYLPFGSSLSYEYMITFSNGHALYLLSQSGNSRGPSIDFNITDEALTINKKKFDHETSATNRGREQIFGKFAPNPVYKHHGNTFASSMGYLPEHKWLTEPAKYYADERGIQLFDIWNKIVNLQLKIIQARIDNENALAIEIYKEAQRLKKQITPFVSKDSVLFMLANAFDGIANKNITFSYLTSQYQTMSLMEFMIEMLNFYISKVTDCYYQIDERHVYYNADNEDYIRGLADNNDFNFAELKNRHSLYDKDCDAKKPIEITPDWGAKISLIEVAQESAIDFVTLELCRCDNNINEFFVKRDKNTDTMINLLIDRFCNYYRYHKKKEVIYTIDTYGDLKSPASTKTFNEHAIARLKLNGWTVTTRRHPGKEPPHNEKYLLWEYMLLEQNNLIPKKRFNGTNCKYTLISMNSTSVIKKPNSFKFEKDKRSEARSSVLPEEATHFGDAVDKRIWTKYGKHLITKSKWVLLN